MKFVRPVVISAETVKMAVCGGGPSGRPCSKRA
jgi:hypothetical protein